MNILVVDDESAMSRLFEQRFRKEIREGLVTFHFAISAEKALEFLKSSGTDLVMILSDINMPGMSGLELLKALRISGMNLPIYMISAYENEAYQKQSLEYGANGFIPKPLDFDAIRSLIMGKRTEGEAL